MSDRSITRVAAAGCGALFAAVLAGAAAAGTTEVAFDGRCSDKAPLENVRPFSACSLIAMGGQPDIRDLAGGSTAYRLIYAGWREPNLVITVVRPAKEAPGLMLQLIPGRTVEADRRARLNPREIDDIEHIANSPAFRAAPAAEVAPGAVDDGDEQIVILCSDGPVRTIEIWDGQELRRLTSMCDGDPAVDALETALISLAGSKFADIDLTWTTEN